MLVLLFDNCEHVVDAAADLIESILAESATVRILTTSREGLGLAEERLWRVSSLEVVAAGSAALSLFAERADSLSPASMTRRPRWRRFVVGSTGSLGD